MRTLPGRPLNRAPVALPLNKMVTHGIVAPLSTHWRKATCAEVECPHYTEGWGLAKQHVTEEVLRAITDAGYRFATIQIKEGEDHLWFEAGQPCFRAAEHRVRLEREELFVMRNGDWRGNPDGANTKPLIFSGADAWKDSLGTTLDRCQG